MRLNSFQKIYTICLIAILALLLYPVNADTSGTKSAPKIGIAFLASSIGTDYSPEELTEFVEQGNYSPVVIDWAWITYHWDRTNFTAVNKFLGLMAAKKVPVAAMYRPRFLSNPTVQTQIDKDGNQTVDHAEICYSDASARQWGIAWGEKILEECPSFREIIIYNPQSVCNCSKCKAISASKPYAAVVGFLWEAKSAWLVKQPKVKLGVVSMPNPEFWKACYNAIDIAHPYLCIREDVDPAAEVANIKAVRPIVKEKMGSCLGKITWEEGAKVSIEKLKMVNNLAYNNDISYFFWTYDTLFKSSLYDPKAVVQALSSVSLTAGNQDNLSNAPDDIKRKWAENLLSEVQNAKHGADQFAAIDVLANKIRESDTADRSAVIFVAIAAMNDNDQDLSKRWPCCYVISRSGDERGVSYLIKILLQDESVIMRGVAAEALGGLPDNAEAHAALLQAARRENDNGVRNILSRYLGDEMPTLEQASNSNIVNKEDEQISTPAAASGVKELAPSGVPQPPPGPACPIAKSLPWPFPGDCKAQNIFNNYQTFTDDYIHCGLDFIHPAGTPVTAVDSGYVSAIWSKPPHTHDFFIITPDDGGSKGWCYTHLDPQTFTFKEGDYIKKGQLLGKLVNFSPNEKKSMDHLHLNYVKFRKDEYGELNPHSLLDPLSFFNWKDTVPPSFLPLRFVSEGTMQQFQANSSGNITVNGSVDILAAITDSTFPGQKSFLGVPVVMLSISDGTHTMQKLVLDHRGDVGDEKQTMTLYFSRKEGRAFVGADSYFPYYQVLRVTKTDGDGKITSNDADQCWDTTALDSSGKSLWPNGQYNVNVYAWDIAGNRGVAGVIVHVKN